MRLMIVTGLSGSGKSTVFKILEDAGFFCVDNLPVSLIPKFVELTYDKAEKMEKAALGIDSRSQDSLLELPEILGELRRKKYAVEILFMEASTEVLVKRFKETRRNHPLGGTGGRLEDLIEEERREMAFLKAQADYIVDTSQMLVRDLKAEVMKILNQGKDYNSFYVTILSFGFKYGIPLDGDLIFDVRFLPNPYYVPELKEHNGNEEEVKAYVMASGEGEEFLEQLTKMLLFLIPRYQKEGKNQLVIGIGCTGGKHRSVTMANALYGRLLHQDFGVRLDHRDIERG